MMVRRAALPDARGIATVHVDAWKVAYEGIVPADVLAALSVDQREEKWTGILTKGHSATWVCEEDGRICGWASAGRSRDPDAADTAGELWALYVHSERWRRGCGKVLWREVVAHLARSGFTAVTVWVLERNEPATAFYQAMGFHDDEGRIKEVEFGVVALAEIRLRYQLPQSIIENEMARMGVEATGTVLAAGPVVLRFREVLPGDQRRGLAPAYHLRISTTSGTEIGHVNFRIGRSQHVMQTAGHVGFEIAPEHRGHSFAYYACRALAPFIARHRDDVILTCDPENAPSMRTIEKLGAAFIEEVSVAPHDPGYVNGARQRKRYSWRVVVFHEHGAR